RRSIRKEGNLPKGRFLSFFCRAVGGPRKSALQPTAALGYSPRPPLRWAVGTARRHPRTPSPRGHCTHVRPVPTEGLSLMLPTRYRFAGVVMALAVTVPVGAAPPQFDCHGDRLPDGATA